MKLRYIVYIIIALVVGYLVFNKIWGGNSKEAAGGKDGGGAGGGKEAKGGKGGAGKKGGPVSVKVMIVKDTTVINNIDVTGTIDANERVNLTSQTAGNITAIYFKEGQRVSKGQLLVKVYDQDLLASAQQLTYQAKLAKQVETRNKALYEKEAISLEEYETSQTGVNTLKAQADLIKAQVARTEIRAPFSGVIGLRNVSPGGYLSPQTSIATLVNMDPAKVTFSVPERYLSLIKPGSKITFTVAASGKQYPATVYAIEPAIDAASRSAVIRAEAPNPKNELTAGSFAKINLTLDQIPKTIMVPTEVVVPDLKSSIVYLVKNGLATPTPVKTDLRTDTKIQITEGLKPGDSLIVSAIIQMRAKVPVVVKGKNKK
ncbi:efflux RND transporter periplasmic adaptor subunit [Mucilaginibacter myungsuensis]|uniref:Efflux RND transporter periplasmic adaptor subunit n=1 Tax=Mucilaginibacter myungsuensis TaxID=649104 RepID=A0A929KUW0_9SPHI|nr:efflux RND transporter periplasmic adaptor subunit [Mucilaginibacter myungsuensis]MBE9661187.1 efflux RND transporter periplasmic adaptor subunit [Mucilaginibacter myungsuensis]MDN3597332.1 efflux RND transporter periplasmic adaptor subunit [Mucilaginibacter myungsuensis]